MENETDEQLRQRLRDIIRAAGNSFRLSIEQSNEYESICQELERREWNATTQPDQ